MTSTDGDYSPRTAETIAAKVRRSTWWAYYGPLPEAPYVRAIIEVAGGAFHESDVDAGLGGSLPRRAQRFSYGCGGDLDWFDFMTEINDRSPTCQTRSSTAW